MGQAANFADLRGPFGRRRFGRTLAIGAAVIAGKTSLPSSTQAAETGMPASPAFLHMGLCVADLDRAIRFYRDGLGFEIGEPRQIDNQFGQLLEIKGNSAHQNCMIKREGVTIELIHFAGADPHRADPHRPMNQPGLTHLAFRVDDVAATAEAIRKAGGTVLDWTRTSLSAAGRNAELIFCTDPDGTRIELTGPASRT